MSKKIITLLLMFTLVLSLACGCKNTDTESTSSTNSKIESSVSSSDESKTESSKPSESSVDKDYEEMMECINQLTTDSTDEEIFNILGKPDELVGSSVVNNYYFFGKYTVSITRWANGINLYIKNTETDQITTVLYPTKPTNPYDETSDYDSEVKDIISKVKSIKVDSTKEDVIKVLGEPDKIENYSIEYDTYDFDKYEVSVVYYNGGLLLDIINKDDLEIINVVYPK